jgi:hypothetical protein
MPCLFHRPFRLAAALAAAFALAGCQTKSETPAAPQAQRAPGSDERVSNPADPASKGGEPAQLISKEPVDNDPPEEKKELFVGWEKPQVALVITGNQHGYIEPCGCTGLENQKGGLARRHSFLKQLADKQWNVVPLDAGNQVRRFGRQAEIQFQLTAEALKKMDYRSVGLGEHDLQLSSGELVASVVSDDAAGPFASANVAVLDRDLMPQTIVVEAGGRKIGVVSVLGDEYVKRLDGGELVLQAAEAGLDEALAQLEAAKCDFRVLMAYASDDDAAALARKHHLFDLVVVSGSPGEPAYELGEIEGTRSRKLHTGMKGMFVCVVGIYDDRQQPLRYQRVPLDARFPDSATMLEFLAGYQEQLKQLGLEGLGVRPLPHNSGRSFVGSETCADCHTEAFAVWEKTPHAHATDSLVHPGERGDIPRHFDPECLSCHVTGWEPQKYFPFTSGYLSLEKTPHLQHNGCENCHGPGSAHVSAEHDPSSVSDDVREMLRSDMRLPLAGGVAERKCMECHDIDNSPDFHRPGAFEKYWKQVEHRGKD